MRNLSLLILALVLTSVGSVASAAPFINLDFEQATVLPVSPPVVPAGSAFPGWTPRINTLEQSTVYYDQIGTGEPAIALYDQPEFTIGIPSLQGAYYAILVGNNSMPPFRASLSQTGDIPAEAKSLIHRDGQSLPACCHNRRRDHSNHTSER